MSLVMMALGPFRFSIDALILQRIDRRLPLRHADQDLVGREPASQFLGPGSERIQLPALIYPVFLPGAGLSQLESMRQTAAAGTPLQLAAATGRVLGRYTIREVHDQREHLLGGAIAQKVEATIDLARYVPVAGGGLGGLFSLFG